MSVLNKLASAPNQDLAKQIAAKKDKTAVQELVQQDKKRSEFCMAFAPLQITQDVAALNEVTRTDHLLI